MTQPTEQEMRGALEVCREESDGSPVYSASFYAGYRAGHAARDGEADRVKHFLEVIDRRAKEALGGRFTFAVGDDICRLVESALAAQGGERENKNPPDHPPGRAEASSMEAKST